MNEINWEGKALGDPGMRKPHKCIHCGAIVSRVGWHWNKMEQKNRCNKCQGWLDYQFGEDKDY